MRPANPVDAIALIHADQLRSAIGAEYLRSGGESDAVDGVLPTWVAAPGTGAEVACLLATANEAGLTVVARGGGGDLDRGAPPRTLDLLLDLRRIDAILEHDPGDMRVSVQAGCTLGALSDVLAPTGQWLPLDPPGWRKVTVGAAIAADLHGPLRASQGRMRDLLLGLKIAGVDGKLVSGGGRVVKNVAGYDLPKVHIGALGTLGVITEATLRLQPLPRSERALILTLACPERAAQLGLELRDAFEPAWLEILGPDTGKGTSGWTLAIGALGHPVTTASAIETWRALIANQTVNENRGSGTVEVYPDGAVEPHPDGAVEPHPDGAALRAAIGAALLPAPAAVLRASTLPSEVGKVLQACAEQAAGKACFQASLLSGTVRVGLADLDLAIKLLRTMRPVLEDGGGALIVERAEPGIKRALHPEPGIFGENIRGLELMRRLKNTFDPRAMLAPGRVAGDPG